MAFSSVCSAKTLVCWLHNPSDQTVHVRRMKYWHILLHKTSTHTRVRQTGKHSHPGKSKHRCWERPTSQSWPPHIYWCIMILSCHMCLCIPSCWRCRRAGLFPPGRQKARSGSPECGRCLARCTPLLEGNRTSSEEALTGRWSAGTLRCAGLRFHLHRSWSLQIKTYMTSLESETLKRVQSKSIEFYWLTNWNLNRNIIKI